MKKGDSFVVVRSSDLLAACDRAEAKLARRRERRIQRRAAEVVAASSSGVWGWWRRVTGRGRLSMDAALARCERDASDEMWGSDFAVARWVVLDAVARLRAAARLSDEVFMCSVDAQLVAPAWGSDDA